MDPRLRPHARALPSPRAPTTCPRLRRRPPLLGTVLSRGHCTAREWRGARRQPSTPPLPRPPLPVPSSLAPPPLPPVGAVEPAGWAPQIPAAYPAAQHRPESAAARPTALNRLISAAAPQILAACPAAQHRLESAAARPTILNRLKIVLACPTTRHRLMKSAAACPAARRPLKACT